MYYIGLILHIPDNRNGVQKPVLLMNSDVPYDSGVQY